MIDPRLIEAQNRVEERRAAFLQSVDVAKERAAPLAVALAKQNVKSTGRAVVDTARREVEEKPLVFGGIAAALGAFLLRKPLGKLASSAYEAVRGSDEEDEEIVVVTRHPPSAKPPPRRERKSGTSPTIEEFREPTRPVEERSPEETAKTDKGGPGKPSRKNKTEEVE